MIDFDKQHIALPCSIAPCKRRLIINAENHIFMHRNVPKYDYFHIHHHFGHKCRCEFFIFIDGWFGKFAILFRWTAHKRTILIDDDHEKNLTYDSCDDNQQSAATLAVSVDRCNGIFMPVIEIECECSIKEKGMK